MSEEQTYKEYTVRLQPHKEYCSEYAFVIIDPRGNEIKHVKNGGFTWENAMDKAKEMIDFELNIEQEKT